MAEKLRQFCLIILYFFTRLLFLTRYPIFNDEAIYLRYGFISINSINNRYISLTHSGKQPLIYWIYGIVMRYFKDPLLAGRLVSVFAGFGTLIMVYSLSRRLFGKRAAFYTGLFTILCPLTVFFDRLALVDSVLVLLYSTIIFLLFQIRKNRYFKYVVILGVIIGISLWIKTTGLILLFTTFCALLYIQKAERIHIKEIFLGLILLIIFPALILLPIVLRPEFSQVINMLSDYVFFPKQEHFFSLLRVKDNIVNTFLIFIGFVSPFILIAFIRILIYKGHLQSSKLWILLFFLPLVIMVGSAKNIHSRYILFTVIPLIILGTKELLKNKYLLFSNAVITGILSILLIVSPVRFFHAFPQKGIFATEAWQYVSGWPSGYGVIEALAFVDENRSGKPAFIALRWDSGNPEDTVLLNIQYIKDIDAGYIDTRLQNMPFFIMTLSQKPVYFITRGGQLGNFPGNKVLIKQFWKPGGKESVDVYTVRLM